jgi:formylglycine-generating enzyme required for sulfatase activity
MRQDAGHVGRGCLSRAHPVRSGCLYSHPASSVPHPMRHFLLFVILAWVFVAGCSGKTVPGTDPTPQVPGSAPVQPDQRPAEAADTKGVAPKRQEPEVYQAWPFDEAEAKRRQKETAQRLGTDVETALDLGNGVKLELVLIPAGKFMMGSPETEKERLEDEVQHEVTLTKPYWIGKYEVTQEAYERVMGNNPSWFVGGRNPVEMVSWDNAQEFCQKLSRRTRREARLPTEAEWEHACRAGRSTPFHTGETISTAEANYNGSYVYGSGAKGENRRNTMAVGSLASNAFGLYDMHGNVGEWCGDWFVEYAKGAQCDPPGAADGQLHVLRGGSWDVIPSYCRSACRYWGAPGRRYKITGFRVVILAEKETRPADIQ